MKYIYFVLAFLLLLVTGYFGYKAFSSKTEIFPSSSSQMTTSTPGANTDAPLAGKMLSVCNLDKSKDKSNKAPSPSTEIDSTHVYTTVDSYSIPSNDLLKKWKASAEGNMDESIKIVNSSTFITMPSLSQGIALMAVAMLGCSVRGANGESLCTINLAPETELEMLTDREYTKTHYTGKKEDSTREKKLVLRGTIDNPGEVTIEGFDKGAPSTFTWSRSNSGEESFSFKSKGTEFTITEKPDCSGTFVLTDDGVSKPGIRQDIKMNWTLQGNTSTGSFTNRTSDPRLSASFSW